MLNNACKLFALWLWCIFPTTTGTGTGTGKESRSREEVGLGWVKVVHKKISLVARSGGGGECYLGCDA